MLVDLTDFSFIPDKLSGKNGAELNTVLTKEENNDSSLSILKNL